MIYYAVKLLLSALIIVVVSEIAKRQPAWAGALASLPMVSLLAIVWLYVDTKSGAQVASLCWSIFWLVLPSLVLFAVLPVLLKQGFGFTWSLALAIVAMLAAYGIMLLSLAKAGVRFS
jgi:hypothetical protein